MFFIFFFQQDHGVAFMETSAKTGMNVDLAFMAVARYVATKKGQQATEKSLGGSIIAYILNT